MNGTRSDLIKIGKYISELRKKKGYTQKALGEIIDVNDKTISKWEKGMIAPDITVLKSLAETLSTDVDSILNGEPISVIKNEEKEITEPKPVKSRKKKFREILFIIIGVVVGTTLINLLNYKESTKYRTFEINEEMFISGFIVETEDKSNLVIDKINYNNDNNEFKNTFIESLTIRVLKDHEVIFEDNECLKFFDSSSNKSNKYNILIDNESDLYESDIYFYVNFKYIDGQKRTFNYKL